MKTYYLYIESEDKLNSIAEWMSENMPTARCIVLSDGQYTTMHISVQDDFDATVMELKWL
jgi:hypothetical protein